MSQEPKRGHFAKEKGEVILREHEYDGIQEYDQKLPNWWLFTFYGAIIWFVVHWAVYYHSSLLKDRHQIVTESIIAVQQKQAEELEKTLATLNDSILVHEWATKPDIVANGEVTFLQVCSACHAADLSATISGGIALPGLPLNDGIWKFGGKPMDVFKIVNEGSPPESDGNNGSKMQPKGGASLTAKQVAEVVSYLITKLPEDFKDIPAAEN